MLRRREDGGNRFSHVLRISFPHDNTATEMSYDFGTTAVVGHDDGRAAHQRFYRHQPEDLVLSGIHDDVGVG
jgi:hypothetical protein